MLNKIAWAGLAGLLISASTNGALALTVENSDQKKTNMESPSKRTSGVHNNKNNMNSKEMDFMQGKPMNSKEMDSMQGKPMNSKVMDSMQGKTSMRSYPKRSSDLNRNKNNSNYGLMSDEYLNLEENNDDLLYFRFAYQISRVGSAKFSDAFNVNLTGTSSTLAIAFGSVYVPAYNDRNLGFNVALGGLISENARAELELTLGSKFTLKNSLMSSFTYKKFEVTPGATVANIAFSQLGFNVATLGINGLYDFPVNDFFVPYLGVGLGIAKLNIDVDQGPTNLDGQTTYPLALNFSAGAKLYFSPKQPINVQYRMLYVSDIDTLALSRRTVPNLIKANYAIKDTDNIKISATYYIHNLDVGVTFTG